MIFLADYCYTRVYRIAQRLQQIIDINNDKPPF